jgi:hypothetical protein
MTAHWIEVTDEREWKLRAEVVGFRPISGEHSGENLGKYFVGLCDRVGITSEKHSKVRRKAVMVCFKIIDNSFQLACSFRA